MELYLQRHGIADHPAGIHYPNDDRPLTSDGIEKMRRTAEGMRVIMDPPDLILSSPMLRTKQTAEIVQKAFRSGVKIETADILLPGATPELLFLYLAKCGAMGRLLLVGHEPDLGFIASTLLGSRGSVIQFKKGSLCRIDVATLPPKKPGKLIWHLSSKQLRLIT